MADTFEETVKAAVSKVTRDENNKIVMPEGLDDATSHAVRSEIRLRDTQSAYTKSQQRNKALEAENSKLLTNWEEDFTKNLTSAQQSELEELKLADPDAWRTKLGELEAGAKTQFTEKHTKIQEEANYSSEEERREQVLEEFNKLNPEIQLTDELIDNEIPPKYVKELKAGKATFEEFLANCKQYLTTGKVVIGTEAPNEPNLSKAGGSSTPDDSSVEAAARHSYDKEIF